MELYPQKGSVIILYGKQWYWDNKVWRRVPGSGGGGTGTCHDMLYYTNPDEVPLPLGGIDAGETFEKVPITTGTGILDMLTKLLYPYISPSFTSFYIDGQSTNLGYYGVIPADIVFKWTIQYPQNVQPGTIAIEDITDGIVLLSNLSNTGEKSHYYKEINQPLGTSRIFRISALNTRGEVFSRTFTVTWGVNIDQPAFTFFHINGQPSVNILSHQSTAANPTFTWNTINNQYIDNNVPFVIYDNTNSIIWSGDNIKEWISSLSALSINDATNNSYQYKIEGTSVTGSKFSKTIIIAWEAMPKPQFNVFTFEGHSPYELFSYEETPENPLFAWVISNSEYVDTTKDLILKDNDSILIAEIPNVIPIGNGTYLSSLNPIDGFIGKIYKFKIEGTDLEGSKFSKEVEVRWLQDGYNPPRFQNFRITTKTPDPVLVGDTLTSVTFAWSILNITNYKYRSIKIYNNNTGTLIYNGSTANHHQNNIPDASQQVTVSINYLIVVTQEFKIVAEDIRGDEFDAVTSFTVGTPPPVKRRFRVLNDSPGADPEIFIDGVPTSPVRKDVFAGQIVEVELIGYNDNLYIFDGWQTILGIVIGDITFHSATKLSFIMPDNAVDIKIKFIDPYVLTLTRSHPVGTLQINAINKTSEQFKAGTSVFINWVTGSGYTFIKWQDLSESLLWPGHESNNQSESLLMPSANITVHALLQGPDPTRMYYGILDDDDLFDHGLSIVDLSLLSYHDIPYGISHPRNITGLYPIVLDCTGWKVFTIIYPKSWGLKVLNGTLSDPNNLPFPIALEGEITRGGVDYYVHISPRAYNSQISLYIV